MCVSIYLISNYYKKNCLNNVILFLGDFKFWRLLFNSDDELFKLPLGIKISDPFNPKKTMKNCVSVQQFPSKFLITQTIIYVHI